MPIPCFPRLGGVVAALFSISASVSQAQNLTPLGSYSVITSGDFSTTSDVEGSTMVGGNLTGSNSANFAIHLQGSAGADQKTLRVAGDISGGNPINLNAGSLELGGSLNGRIINYNGGGSLIMNPGLDFSSVFAQLDAASSTLSSYQANSMASIPSGQPGPYVITANPDSDGRAVLLLDGSSLFGNHMVQQIDLAVNGASEILINVSGTSVDWLSGNFVGAFTNTEQRRNIVWNFYEATSVNFGARNMMGQVLAPLAHVTSQGNIDGSIYAKSLSTTGEVHLPGYGGSFTNTVPEPGAMMLCALGAMLLGVRRR